MIGKSEIVHRLAEKTGMSDSKANHMLNTVIETVSEALSRGEEVRITGFGSFKVAETKERMAMNPRTREPVRVPAGKRVSFSPGSQLSSFVKGEGTRKAA